MKTIRDINALRDFVRGWRQDGETVSFVPTMGNLHRGHMSLIDLAQEYGERVAVSVFVNPTQFGPDDDYEEYPRTLELDRRRLSRAGVDVLFAPSREEMYPRGVENMTVVSVPELSAILCGEQRPGHFDGVTSVVSRLFNIIRPSVAVFGQKDYQQLVIIRRMVSDLQVPLKVVAGPTLREKDGLAMSSRNQYLTEQERAAAPGLYRALNECRDRLTDGFRNFAVLESTGRKQLVEKGFSPDYFVVRKAGDLAEPDSDSKYLVVMAAAQLGKARLIDNVLFEG